MTTTTKAITYGVSVVGGSFQYGAIQVSDSVTNAVLATYPAHFVLNAAGVLVDPMTDETGQALGVKLDALAAAIAAQTALLESNVITLTDAFGASPTAVPVTDVFGTSLGQIAS